MAWNSRDKAVTIIDQNISSAAQSASFNTNKYDITNFNHYALQIVITSASSLNIAIKVQESLDGTNWADYPGSSVTFTTNTTYIWNTQSSSNYTRLAVTFTGGSGIFQCYAFSKI